MMSSRSSWGRSSRVALIRVSVIIGMRIRDEGYVGGKTFGRMRGWKPRSGDARCKLQADTFNRKITAFFYRSLSHYSEHLNWIPE